MHVCVRSVCVCGWLKLLTCLSVLCEHVRLCVCVYACLLACVRACLTMLNVHVCISVQGISCELIALGYKLNFGVILL